VTEGIQRIVGRNDRSVVSARLNGDGTDTNRQREIHKGKRQEVLHRDADVPLAAGAELSVRA
jgi:hypothetical protein